MWLGSKPKPMCQQNKHAVFGLCQSSGTKVAFRFCPSGGCRADLVTLCCVGWNGLYSFSQKSLS